MTYTFHTGNGIEHAEHTWEVWSAQVSPGDLPTWVSRDDTGVCCHTCEVIVVDRPEPEPECIDPSMECEGTVEYRMPLSGTGKSFPRCDKHWDIRLDTQRGIDERYPTHAPSDFDPSYAGESWNGDY